MSTQDGNNLPEAVFRGFEKVPIVVCERIDAIPFINLGVTPKVQPTVPKPSKMLECSVKLIRADLDCFQTLHLNSKNKLPNNTQQILKCKICKKVYTSEKRLQNHQEKKHMIVIKTAKPQKRVSFSDHVIVHEVKEYHKCRKCPKIYEDYKSLKVHMKLVHKKRKCYICFYCSRDFADRMFFKMHIKLHCGKCGVLFPNKTQFQEHRRNVCKDIKKYPCKCCPDVFFSFMHLKDHSYQHEGIFVVCDICKERLSSLCMLAHHIDKLHSAKHRKSLYSITKKDDLIVYECNFCEIRCIDEEFVQGHVRLLPSFTNKKRKYYFCDQCYERFDLETDMLQHKWKHFLKKDPRENNEVSSLKETYHVDEELPKYLKTKLILHRLPANYKRPVNNPPEKGLLLNTLLGNNLSTIESSLHNLLEKQPENGIIQSNDPVGSTNNQKTPNVLFDPKHKRKILFSKYQCEKCGKYLSTNYCLNRHMQTMHGVKENTNWDPLQCPNCEEIFVWPSLLKSHNCIRMQIPEMPFDDARPEIQFDNLYQFGENSFDQLLGHEEQNIDFEIPAPIVQLTEYEGYKIIVNDSEKNGIVHSKASNISIQEVPVEF